MLYLASRSPRRAELLTQIGVHYTQIDVTVDESSHPAEAAADYVARVALLKAHAGWALDPEPTSDRVVLGADTAVVVDTDILGKPESESHGLAMLRCLSGRTHQVMSAIAVVSAHQQAVKLATTEVSFRTLSEPEIQAYWHTGEPRDKAGGYGIQGFGAVFVEHIQGNYSTVVGLPLFELMQLLTELDIPCWQKA